MPDQTLRMRDLTARFAVTRRTIHRWITDLQFPKGSGRLGRKGHFWSASEVDRWEAWQDARSDYADEVSGDDPR